MRKVLLYSGGMDSWLIDKLWKPDVKLFFRIGTKNNDLEFNNIDKRGVTIIDLPLDSFEQKENNFYLPLRNLHFVVYAAHYGDTICLGATGSSTHKDKNETFSTLSENVINYLLSEDTTRDKPVKIVLPYKDCSKTELLSMYLKAGGDIEDCYNSTFSCYTPIDGRKPCMTCTSCTSKFTAFYNNGKQFTDEEIKTFIDSVLSNPKSKGDSLELALRLKYGNNTICIDFDNTITSDSKFPVTGELREGCKEYLDKLVSKGYRLVLFTSRKGHDFDNAVEFCKEHKLPFSDYISGKPIAHRYIDDKAISFTEWRDMEDL